MNRLILSLCMIFSLFGCSIIKDITKENINARAQLIKCKYEIKDIKLTELGILDWLIFDDGVTVDIRKGNFYKKLLNKIKKLKNYQYTLKLSDANFEVSVNIKNTTKHDVTFDKMEAFILFDEAEVTKFEHKKFVHIKPGKESTETINVKIPLGTIGNLFARKVKQITTKATIYVTLLINGNPIDAPVKINFEKNVPFPSEIIRTIINKKKQALTKKLLKKISQKLKKGFTDIF